MTLAIYCTLYDIKGLDGKAVRTLQTADFGSSILTKTTDIMLVSMMKYPVNAMPQWFQLKGVKLYVLKY